MKVTIGRILGIIKDHIGPEKLCEEESDHRYHGVGFSGNKILWQCSYCGRIKSETDKPVTI